MLVRSSSTACSLYRHMCPGGKPLAPHPAFPLPQEYRDTTLNGAVEQMYQEMGSRHRVRSPCIQIIKTATLTASQVRGAPGRAGGPWQLALSVVACGQAQGGLGSGRRGWRMTHAWARQCTCMLPAAGSARCPARPCLPTALLKCAPPRSLRPAVQARGHAAAARQQDQLPAGAQGAAPLVPVSNPAWLCCLPAAYQPLAKLAVVAGLCAACASVGQRSPSLFAACFCPGRMVRASHALMPLPLIVCPSASLAPAASSAPPSRRCAPTWPSTERLPLEQLAATLAAAAAAAATQLARWSGAAEEEAARPARARRRSARRRRRRQPGGGGSAPRPRPAARLGARLQARVNTR